MPPLTSKKKHSYPRKVSGSIVANEDAVVVKT